jgi:RNA polymerase sigma factor (sigma-70 family)
MQHVMEGGDVQTLRQERGDALVDRFGDLVFAAALRQMGDVHAAADVVQVVFMVMTRKQSEGKLPAERFMAGWLLQVTRYAVKEAKRATWRRRRHERGAAEVRPEALVENLETVAVMKGLDEALLALGVADREVIARRFLRGESVGDMAAALGMTENTASKRIERALVKLRGILARRGVTMGVSAIAGVIASEALVKMPTAVAAKAGGTAVGVSGHVARKVLWRMAMIKVKVAAALMGVGVLLGGGATLYVQSSHGAEKVEKQIAATAPADFGPTTLNSKLRHFGDVPMGRPRKVPAQTELSKRYAWIFSELNEKHDADVQIEETTKEGLAAINREDPTEQDPIVGAKKKVLEEHLLAAQATFTATLWNHIEAAVKQVAPQHGEGVAALNDVPELPVNPAEVSVEKIVLAIQQREVIPLNDDMAREVLALANAEYAKEKPAASQP